jgi:hypothetical protein
MVLAHHHLCAIGFACDFWDLRYITTKGDIALDSLQFADQVTGPLYVDTQYFNHAVSNAGFILAYYIGWLDYDAVINGTDFSFDTQASYFRIGDTIEGVSFPGESLTRNAHPILEAMTSPHRLFVGLTGDTLGYYVSSLVLSLLLSPAFIWLPGVFFFPSFAPGAVG